MAGHVGAATFMWVSSLVVLVLLTPVMLTRVPAVTDAFSQSFWVLVGAAVSLMAATLMNLEALKREELSYTAPLNSFVPIFTLLIAAVVLSEYPPLAGVTGILAIFVGAYIINLRPSRIRWYDPITHLVTNTGARLCMGVALAYAFNTVFFKVASNHGHDGLTILYTTMGIAWLLLLYVPFTKRQELKDAMRSNKLVVFGAAISSFVGSFFHILAVAGTYASYAVSVRRLDSIISILLGWRYLKETNIRNKLIGSAFMTIGVIIMAIS